MTGNSRVGFSDHADRGQVAKFTVMEYLGSRAKQFFLMKVLWTCGMFTPELQGCE